MKNHTRERPIAGIRRWAVGLAAVAGLLIGQTALAAPLGLDLLPLGPGSDPDIFAGLGNVTYTAATDSLVVSAQPQTIFSGGASNGITAGLSDFSLTATIDDFGNLVGGALSISGVVPALGFNSGTLLTGNLTNFGFGGAGSVLEWEFNVTGGDAAGLWGGQLGGVILGGSGFGGSWGSDFSASFTATADVGIVPEPSTVLLLGIGLSGLALRGRARR